MPIEIEMMTLEDRRKEFRTSIEMIAIPFLGSCSTDGSCFEYKITDISRYGLQMAVSVDGETSRLNTNDTIDLHVGFGWDGVAFDQGIVIWLMDGTEKGTKVCGVKAELAPPSPYELWFSTDTCDAQIGSTGYESGNELLLAVLERCVATKDGISRALSSISDPASGRPKGLREAAYYWQIMTDQELQRLIEYSCFIRATTASDEPIGQRAPPDELKQLLKSDVHSALTGARGIWQGPDPSVEQLRALEARIRSDYNTIVLLWACYLSYVYKTA
jgi:hypothetical protein